MVFLSVFELSTSFTHAYKRSPMSSTTAAMKTAYTEATSSEKAEPEDDSKSDPRSGHEYPRHRIPTRIRDDRLTEHEPGVIGRHVDHFRVSRFDDDCVALSCYLLLFIAIQVAGLAGLLTHGLDGVRHCLLLIGVCVAKRGSPREVLVHV